MAPLATIAAKDPLTSRSARTQLKALTAQTGGVLFNVTRNEVDDVVPTLLELSAPDSVLVRGWRVSKMSRAIGDVEIPVDESFREKISFMVTASTSAALPSFTLLDPVGNVVTATTLGVTRLKLGSVDKYTVTTPMQGTWRMRFKTAGDFVARAFGQSALLASDIRLLDPAIPPVTPDIDLMPVEGQPAIGKDLVVDVGVTAAVASVDAIAVRAENGTLLQTLVPTMYRARSYRVSFVPPAEPFLLEVAGTSVGGSDFVRQTALPFRPQAVALSVFPKTAMASAGSSADIDVTVTNAASTDAVYTLIASSASGWPIGIPSTVSVDAGKSTTATLSVSVPADASAGEVASIVLLVSDTGDPTVRNSASAAVQAMVNQPPVCTAAAPSVPLLWPPNHKMSEVAILGVTDPDGDAVSITMTAITQDEPVISKGSGQTAPDAGGIGSSGATVRAERDGGGDGRVYALHFSASDGRGGSCMGVVNVGVPHDKGGVAVDSGQAYDATTAQ